MKKLTLILLVLTFCATAFAGESQLQKATNVVNEIMGTPDKGIPDELLGKSVCVGIVSSQLKFALGVSGAGGRLSRSSISPSELCTRVARSLSSGWAAPSPRRLVGGRGRRR